jgi:hypothetical protein
MAFFEKYSEVIIIEKATISIISDKRARIVRLLGINKEEEECME